MASIENTPLLLHGIGKGIIKTPNNVLAFTTAQSMNLNTTTSTEDVYGGDGLFPLWTYLSQKECSVEIQDAGFQLDQLAVAQGTEVSKAGNKRMVTYIFNKTTTNVSEAAITGFAAEACVAPDGSVVEIASEAGDDVISISTTGEVKFGTDVSAQEGEYTVWGMIDDDATVKVSLLKAAMCDVGEFFWTFVTEDTAGVKYQIDLHAKRVRANGEFSIETSRDGASTPTLTINVLDPGNGDDHFMHVNVTKLS